MSDCFLGEIRMFAGSYNPQNWVFCNGAQMSVQQYQALYSLIGITYGGGPVTFNLPDLRGRVPIGQGTGSTSTPPLTARTIGQTGGEETHTLASGEMPAHSHPVYASTGDATSQVVGPTMLYGTVKPSGATTGLYSTSAPPVVTVVQLDAKAVSVSEGGQFHNNMMVTTAISFIMATLGNYPQRPN